MVAQFNENKFIWIPRVLAILFALFLSLFAFDIEIEEFSLVQYLMGVLIHLIPVFMVIIALALTWKYLAVSGFLFIILGIVFTVFFHTYRDYVTFLVISLPLLIIGILVIIAYWLQLNNNNMR